jgi:site-specific DNA recombinase
VDAAVFDKVQAMLQRNARTGGADARNRYGALLKRLLYCKACGKAMIHTFTGRGQKRYRYYTCGSVIKGGRTACPAKSLPAAEIERVVVDRIRCVARDKRLVADVVQQAAALAQGDLAELKVERKGLQRDLARYHAEIRKLAMETPPQAATTARIADLYDQAARVETRLAEVRQLIENRESEQFDEGILASAFADFDATWNALSPREQAQALQTLVARVEYDVAESTVAVTFHETGIRALGRNLKGEAA